MGRRFWPLILLAIPACAPEEPPDPPDKNDSGALEPATLMRVIAIGDDKSRVEVREAVPPSKLVGQYSTGDRLGYNLDLDLRADGSFNVTWRGCLGVYGTAVGTWIIEPDGVALTSARADGLLAKRPLGRLFVASLGGFYLLVDESFYDLFVKQGPSHETCLHKESAEGAVDAAHRRGR